jgi:hypothetical protein
MTVFRERERVKAQLSEEWQKLSQYQIDIIRLLGELVTGFKKENADLKEKLTLAVKALEEAAEWLNRDDPNGTAGEIAFEALKKIKEEGGGE